MPYKDKEKVKKKMKKWYQKNRKTELLKSKQWKIDNPEWIKQWKLKNPEYDKQWRKNHPERVKEKCNNFRHTLKGRFSIYKGGSKHRGLIFGITFNEFLDIINQPCYYCGGEGYGIDRIDNTMGYLKDNIVSCCSMCNYMKQVYAENEFIEQCIKISNKWKKKKVI